MGTLYLVATPIGNLEDITLRALRVLREVPLIAAEDTRNTRRLLGQYGIQTRLISYHEHNKITRLNEVLAALEKGDVALVSDAGTPGLNDPGYELVRAALQDGKSVCPLPGAAAPIVALVASGLPTDTFLYLGYLPRKPKERRKRLEEIASFSHTLVFLEAPHRLLSALEDIRDVLGDRRVSAARELTKLFEEFIRGNASDLIEHFRAMEPRGEFTLVVEGSSNQAVVWDEDKVRQAIQNPIHAGLPTSELAREIAKASGWHKKDVYRILVEMKQGKI